MKFLDDLMTTLPSGRVVDVNIGLHWTAVLVDVSGQLRCGLATTLPTDHQHGVPDVLEAGNFTNLPVLTLADLRLSLNLERR